MEERSGQEREQEEERDRKGLRRVGMKVERVP